MELARWKVIAGGACLLGVVAGGIAAADDAGIDLNDRRAPVALSDAASSDSAPNRPADASPESADSPNESVAESADSPFDSPDDPRLPDFSPESADSPDASFGESANSPFDSPDDPQLDFAPPPPPPPAPAPAPAPAADSYESPVSFDSPDSGDS
jgi:hypothetical protein